MQAVNLSSKKKDANGTEEAFAPTPDELQSISKKMEDPQFRQLLQEYMEALQDPEARAEEEAYLRQAEAAAHAEGDCSFEFVFPTPQFVVQLLRPSTSLLTGAEASRLFGKTAAGNTYKEVKTYLNMCTSEKIEVYREEQLFGQPQKGNNNKATSSWHVPVSVSLKRTEYYAPMPANNNNNNNSNNNNDLNVPCFVYDAVFHPKTLLLTAQSEMFLKFLVEIVVDQINEGYKDSHGYEFQRLPSAIVSIGTPKNQTVRAPAAAPGATALPVVHQDPKAPADKKTPAGKKNTPATTTTTTNNNNNNNSNTLSPPPFTIAHRGRVELTDAWNWKVSERRVGVPEELVVKLNFRPATSNRNDKLKASDLDVDITSDGTGVQVRRTERQQLYEGLVVLPFAVELTPSSAKFERNTEVLTLVLRVVPPQLSEEQHALREELQQRHTGQGEKGEKQEPDDENTTAAPAVKEDEEEVKKEESKEEVNEKETIAQVEDSNRTNVAPDTKETVEEATTTTTTTTTNVTVAPETFTTPNAGEILSADEERVRRMLERVAEARQAREGANVNTDEGKGAVADAADAAETKTTEEPTVTKPKTNEASSPETEKEVTSTTATNVADVEEEIPFITKKQTSDAAAEAELHARQDAWRQLVAQQEKELRAEEEKERKAAARREAKAAALERRRREEEEEENKLREALAKKMKEIPISNAFIFAID